MSYSRSSSSRMHCKVCESAKKSPAVIASHFPKNRDGFTVCPTLLSQQCKGCGKKGHTIGYCTLKQEPEAPIKPITKTKTKEVKQVVKQTMYDALYVSDEEQEQIQEVAVSKVKKAPKETKKETKPFCWATAESDSSGSDTDSD